MICKRNRTKGGKMLCSAPVSVAIYKHGCVKCIELLQWSDGWIMGQVIIISIFSKTNVRSCVRLEYTDFRFFKIKYVFIYLLLVLNGAIPVICFIMLSFTIWCQFVATTRVENIDYKVVISVWSHTVFLNDGSIQICIINWLCWKLWDMGIYKGIIVDIIRQTLIKLAQTYIN